MEKVSNQKIKFDTIRKKWDEEKQKWYFSIVDIVGLVVETSNPRNYWKVLKNRLNKGSNKLVTECNQLKLEALDGKFYLTDVADIRIAVEILNLVSEKNSLPFKAWALALSKPKETKDVVYSKIKIGNEVCLQNKEKSYPQVTYNLAKLMNKNTENPDAPIEIKKDKKIFEKVYRMKTI